jgi:hypothetical protein
LPINLPGGPATANLGAIRFGSTGAVQAPQADASKLFIPLVEGHRDSNVTITTKRKDDTSREAVSVARYTGRATLDILDILSL